MIMYPSVPTPVQYETQIVIHSTDSSRATYLGATKNTGVTRFSLNGIELSAIRSIRIEDDNLISGGDGIASGYDLDFIKFSTQQTSSATVSAMFADNSIDFNSAIFKAGYLQPTRLDSEFIGQVLYGVNTDGTVNLELSSFSIMDGALSLGEGGSISFNLSKPFVPSTELYLYVGDFGGGNDNFRVVFSDQVVDAGVGDYGIRLKGDDNSNSIRLGEGVNANIGKGNDTIYGYGGADDLYAASGDDLLLGGSDNDTLDGGVGNDIMQGEIGNDTYYFGIGYGNDVIIDVEGSDTLIMRKLASTDVTFERIENHPNDLKMIIKYSKESIYLTDQLNSNGSFGIDSFIFTDKSLTKKNVSDSLVKPKPVDHPPTGTLAINGTAVEGNQLNVTNTFSDVDGLGKFSYQWLNNGIAIPGEIKTAYTLTRTDVGKTIGVHIKFSDGLKNSYNAILNFKSPTIPRPQIINRIIQKK